MSKRQHHSYEGKLWFNALVHFMCKVWRLEFQLRVIVSSFCVFSHQSEMQDSACNEETIRGNWRERILILNFSTQLEIVWNVESVSSRLLLGDESTVWQWRIQVSWIGRYLTQVAGADFFALLFLFAGPFTSLFTSWWGTREVLRSRPMLTTRNNEEEHDFSRFDALA